MIEKCIDRYCRKSRRSRIKYYQDKGISVSLHNISLPIEKMGFHTF